MTQSKESFTDLNDNGLLDLDVYFDFTCPYSYQAALWATSKVIEPSLTQFLS